MESIIIVLLIFTSVVGLTFIVERGLALRRSRIIPAPIATAVEVLRSNSDLDGLKKLCEAYPSPIGRLILLAEKHRDWARSDNENALQTRARYEVTRMERGLVILEIIVGISPLLGLVGTIYGLIMLFNTLGPENMSNSAGLSKGIATALYATLFGPLAAIPSLVAWSYYNKKVETMAVEMESLCEEFLKNQYQMKEDRPGPAKKEDKAART